MLTFYCRIDKLNTFLTLLGKVESSYVDFIIHNDSAVLVSMDSEVFVSLNCKLDFGSHSEDLVSFRVNANDLKHVLYEGILEVRVSDNIITLIGTNAVSRCSVEYSFSRQICYFSNVINILQDVKEFLSSEDKESMRCNIVELESLYKLNKYLKDVICVEDNYAYISNKNYIAYKKCKCDNFSLSYKAFNFIFSVTSMPFNYRNKFVFCNSNVIGFSIKSKMVDIIDFDFIESKKSTYKCLIDFSNVCNIYKTLKWSECDCSIDLGKNCMSIGSGNNLFKFPIDIKNGVVLAKIKQKSVEVLDLDLSDDDVVSNDNSNKLPIVKLSKDLLFKIVPILSSCNTSVQLELKKDFAIFRNDVNILFRRIK